MQLRSKPVEWAVILAIFILVTSVLITQGLWISYASRRMTEHDSYLIREDAILNEVLSNQRRLLQYHYLKDSHDDQRPD